MTLPTAIPSDGNVKVVWVPTIADPANPTVAEVTATSCVDLSCYLTGDGWTPSTDTQVTTDDRLCSVQTFEDLGRYTDKLAIKYVYQGQAPTAVDNKAQSTLRRGTRGYLVVRWGAPYTVDLAAGDVVDTLPAVCDVQQKQPPEANGKLKIMQDIRIPNSVERDVLVVS